MDAQHQQLVRIVNELFDALSQGKGNDILDKIFSELVTYTIKHFADEEKVMQKHGYPKLTQHKIEHKSLTQQVQDFIKQKESGQTMLSIKVVNFLKGWLVNHIQGSDRQYGIHIQEQQKGAA